MFRKLVSSTLVITLTVLLGTTHTFAGKPPAPTNQTPVVTAFDVAAESASPVTVDTFTATDADGTIAGYLITETSAKPSANAGGWTPTAPTQYVTSTVGTVTLYAWAKDDKDAVSNSLSDTVAIPQPPINADTLDNIDSTGFAAAAHDHDGVYQKKYANVVAVAKSGGDFTDPCLAVASITDASADKPCLMKIMPGVYDIGSSVLHMKLYVDIEGSGESTTRIVGHRDARDGGGYYGVVNGAGGAELRWLSVENNGPGDVCAGVSNVAAMRNVSITTTSCVSANVAIYQDNQLTTQLTDVTATATGGRETRGMSVGNTYAVMKNVKSTASGGLVANTGIYFAYAGLSTLTDSEVTVDGPGANSGVMVYMGAGLNVRGLRVTATGGTQSSGISAHSTVIKIDASVISGSAASLSGLVGAFGQGARLLVGSTRLEGGRVSVDASSSAVCAGVYDEEYAFYPGTCP